MSDASKQKRKKKRHPGTLRQRGGSYMVYLCVGGKRYHFTIRTTDRREASAFAVAKDRELRGDLRSSESRRRMGLPGAITVSELLSLFEKQEMPTLTAGTRSAYKDSLKVIRQYFVDELIDPPLDRIHAKQVAGFLAWRRVHPMAEMATVSNRTLQKDRAVLHRLFAIAERMEFRDGNPVSRVEPPKADSREPVILNVDEYEQLLKACDGRPMLELYVLVLGEAGLRCESEALRLQWSDVDLEDGFLWVSSSSLREHRTKGGKGRHVPMTARLAAAMKRHFADHRFASYAGERPVWVFHHPVTQGKRTSGKRVGSLRGSFTAAVQRAKLPAGFHQHDLRHRRVTTWLAEGKDVVKVKEAMGHSDLRTTMGYMHLVKENLRSLVEPAAAPAIAEKAG